MAPPRMASAPRIIALNFAAGPYSARRWTTDGAATSAAPKTIIPAPAHRRPRAESHHTRAASSAMAGISGKMYCGRLLWESEKKRKGMRIQSQKNVRGSLFVVLRSTTNDEQTTTVHGSAPKIKNGTKYHGGPVRLSAPVV